MPSLKPMNGIPNKKYSDNLSWISVYDPLSIIKDEALTLNTSSSSSSSGINSTIFALEPDGSLCFFWFDYLKHEGKPILLANLRTRIQEHGFRAVLRSRGSSEIYSSFHGRST
jgi:DNA polymerase alpha subunit A